MDQPLKKDRSTSDQPRPGDAPRAETGQNDRTPQPMAHPPEDTFEVEDSHRRPGRKVSPASNDESARVLLQVQ